ncbi:family 43 glycosylhydrolase [candidate division KSB1 bacterium]|nr:family 43 glycosylhydrolase [candidate division KSB1 bacterium]
MNRILLSITLIFTILTASTSHASAPEIGKSARYCNPLPMPTAPGGNAAGDVTVIKEQGKYYMYCTGGGAWVSEDMLNWTFQHVENVPIAPDVVKYNDEFYMCGNDGPLFKADNPLGPFIKLGDWKNTPDVAGGWNGAFDMDIYIDDDNKPYLFYAGRGVSGIFVVELNPNDLTRFAGPVKHLIGFNSDHVWERYGEMNEYTDVSWIEGSWLQKHNGVYYLQYSACGTQWKTYAEGYYTGKSPMGPFTYAPNNPLLRKTEGIVTGPAHGSIVEGPDGNLWQFYTIVLSNPPGGRRIGMDRITFDKNGNMSVQVTETPQWAPGTISDPTKGNSGSIPVTINKVRAMNALSKFSSEQPGREAAYAVDNYSGTWWEPSPADSTPTLTIELSPATRFDVVQLFTIDAVRLMFKGNRRWFRRASETELPKPDLYQYKIDVSMDGDTYITALDQTKNAILRNTIFEEISPVKCHFVRLTITEWPRTTPLGIIEFTIFGKPAESLPAQEPIPETR